MLSVYCAWKRTEAYNDHTVNVETHYNKDRSHRPGVWRLGSQRPPLRLSQRVQEQGTFVGCHGHLTTRIMIAIHLFE